MSIRLVTSVTWSSTCKKQQQLWTCHYACLLQTWQACHSAESLSRLVPSNLLFVCQYAVLKAVPLETSSYLKSVDPMEWTKAAICPRPSMPLRQQQMHGSFVESRSSKTKPQVPCFEAIQVWPLCWRQAM